MYKNCLLLVDASHEEKGGGEKTACPFPSLIPLTPPPLPFRCLPWSLFTEARGLFLLLVILTNVYIIAAHCTTPDPQGGGGEEVPNKVLHGKALPQV